jgi:hypothetical protein
MGMKKTGDEKKTERKRGKSGRFLPKEKPAEAKPGGAGEGRPRKKVKDPYKHLPPRSRVKKAQEMVLDEMRNIVQGNCNSAKKGNYNAAKFVLDWAGGHGDPDAAGEAEEAVQPGGAVAEARSKGERKDSGR